MADKTERIRELAQNKAKTRQAEVLSVIAKMKKSGEKITFYGIAKATGASKSYLYKNEAIATAIRECQDGNVAPRTEKSDKAIIASLRLEVKRLKQQLKELNNANSESYKQKYENALQEISELKKQLENAYTVW